MSFPLAHRRIIIVISVLPDVLQTGSHSRELPNSAKSSNLSIYPDGTGNRAIQLSMASKRRQTLCGRKDKPMATQHIPEAEQILHVPLTDIKLSNTNPRSDIYEQELKELAANIAASRVHEPILVRPLKDGKAKYELVFGERRYRASERAKKKTIPTILRQMPNKKPQHAPIPQHSPPPTR